MPVPQIQNPAGVYGLTASGNEQGSLYQTFLNSGTEAIVAGNVVERLTGGGVKKGTLGTTGRTGLGIAIEDVAVNDTGLVAQFGPVTALKGTGAVTAGDVVTVDTAVAGKIGFVITPATAVTQYKDITLGVGIVIADASAAATSARIFLRAI